MSQFLTNVYRLLQRPNHHIYWEEYGKSFVIADIEKFIHEVLPRRIKLSFEEFIRNLTEEGFDLVAVESTGLRFSRIRTYVLEDSLVQSWIIQCKDLKARIRMLELNIQSIDEKCQVLIQENAELKRKLGQFQFANHLFLTEEDGDQDRNGGLFDNFNLQIHTS